MAKKTYSANKKKKVTTSRSVKKKSKGSNKFIILLVAVVIILVSVFIFNVVNKNSFETVNTISELDEKTGIRFKTPDDASNITYGVEKGNIARMDYTKITTDGNGMMDYTLRSSSDEQENNVGLPNNWGTMIVMTVTCGDDSQVEVKSCVSTDQGNIMKATWYDNDKYYLMTTSNLVTREDFLQEVNRVVIANHVSF